MRSFVLAFLYILEQPNAREWADWISWFATVTLAIAAIAGILFAWRTLRALERQTAALVASQVPYISIALSQSPMKTLFERTPRVVLAATNEGLTPAYAFTYESWVELCPKPFTEFSSKCEYFKMIASSTLHPKNRLTLNVPIQAPLSTDEFEDMRKLQKLVCVRIRTCFTDCFGNSRISNFAYAVLPDGLEPLSRYNDP
jgi:hypothetical protein